MDRLDHIHATLADALQRTRPKEAFAAPVTVAEIYQDLVPYRAVRTQLGFDMNADYEHTLLRLLAGEGGLARLEPPEARDELRAELDSANPNVGLFRKFAACDVWIVRPRGERPVVEAPVPEAARAATVRQDGDTWEARSALWLDTNTGPAGADDADDDDESFELLLEDEIEIDGASAVSQDASITDAMPLARSEAAPALAQINSSTPEEPRLTTVASSAGERTAAASPSTACAFCDSALPRGRAAKFCPFCGADQALVPCGSCGEALEPDWRFCIACGAGTEKH
jgi:hypothetical protein